MGLATSWSVTTSTELLDREYFENTFWTCLVCYIRFFPINSRLKRERETDAKCNALTGTAANAKPETKMKGKQVCSTKEICWFTFIL